MVNKLIVSVFVQIFNVLHFSELRMASVNVLGNGTKTGLIRVLLLGLFFKPKTETQKLSPHIGETTFEPHFRGQIPYPKQGRQGGW